VLSVGQTFDPYTGEQKTFSTVKGAVIGADVSAVLAYLANKKKDSKARKRKILQTAGIGAIARGGVGCYMDRQEAKLRKTLRDSGMSVKLNRDDINWIMLGNITFASNGH
jgi:outer membrane protein OmpA-like peptidoglycan-associated protein